MTRLVIVVGVFLTLLPGCDGSASGSDAETAARSGPPASSSPAAQPAETTTSRVAMSLAASCVAAWNTASPTEWRDAVASINGSTLPSDSGAPARPAFTVQTDQAGTCVLSAIYGAASSPVAWRQFTFTSGDPITDPSQVTDVQSALGAEPVADLHGGWALDIVEPDGHAEFTKAHDDLNSLVETQARTYLAAVSAAAPPSDGSGATGGQTPDLTGSGVAGRSGEEVFSTTDGRERCYAKGTGQAPAELTCIGNPSAKTVSLVAGSGATYTGKVPGGQYLVGTPLPEGTSRRVLDAFRCGASWRGIRCTDLTGSGQGFIIGDYVVILTANGREVSRH
jgi:hypothetical protein